MGYQIAICDRTFFLQYQCYLQFLQFLDQLHMMELDNLLDILMAFSYVWINTQQIRKLDLIMIQLEQQASS